MTAVTFLAPPLGLAPQVHFDLAAVAEADGLCTLTSADGVRLFLLDAAHHLPGYAPVLGADPAHRLGLTAAEQARVLVVVNPAAEPATVNLLAPVVLHTGTGAALQVVLDDARWPLQHPIGAPVPTG